jgi:hypothetical protein
MVEIGVVWCASSVRELYAPSQPLCWGGWLWLVGCARLRAVVHQGGVWVQLPCFLVRVLGTSCTRGVRRLSSVRPPAVGFARLLVCGLPVGVRPPS